MAQLDVIDYRDNCHFYFNLEQQKLKLEGQIQLLSNVKIQYI